MIKMPSLPLKALPPLVIPVANSSIKIDADDYLRLKRHLEFIGVHLNKTAPNVAESLNGYESWASFFRHHFIERSSKKELLREISRRIEKTPDIISVVASTGWGKTFLLRDIAVQFSSEARPVLWLNPYATIEGRSDTGDSIVIGKWDLANIDSIIGRINSKVKEQSLKKTEGIPIIIADNCSERIEELISLFSYLNRNNRVFLLIISFRDYEFNSIIKNRPILERRGVFRPEGRYDSSEEVNRLVDFCAKHKVGIENEIQKERVMAKIIKSEADKALILALQIIFDKNHRPFSDIVGDFWKNLPNENARSMVLRVSVMHRFGSSFYPRLYSLLNTFPKTNQFNVLFDYDKCL